MTLTQLGQVFDATSHQVGEWLVELGFRTQKKKPSSRAFDEGFVKQGPSRNQGYNWVWDSKKTVAALIAAGHDLALKIPEEIAEPPKLVGPFSSKAQGGARQIVNGEGRPIACVAGEANEQFVLKLLNGADRVGMIIKR